MTRVLVSLVAAVAASLALVAGASAGLSVRKVDARSYPTIRASVVTSEPSETAPALSENGRTISALSAKNLGRAKSVVLAVDRSQSMDGGALENATLAARQFVAAKPPSDRIALVAFGSTALAQTRFSSAVIDADTALRTLAIDDTQGTALHDAIVLAAEALQTEPLGGRVIIVLTDGADVSSKASMDEAVAAARKAGATVYPIGIEGPQFSPAPLDQLARETGGRYYGTDSTEALGDVYGAIAGELARTWQLEYVTAARPGEQLRLEATLGADKAAASLRLPGTPERTGAASRLLPGFLAASSGGTLLLALIVAGLVFLAAVLLSARPRGGWLRERIDPHVSSRARSHRRRTRGRRESFDGVLRATERSFGHMRLWRRLERQLERADLPLRAAEFVYIAAGSGLGLGLFAGVLGLPSLFVLLAIALGGAAPIVFVTFKAKKRSAAFEAQLPDLLVALASSLKAGHSFRQGLQTVCDEGRPPASKEFKRVLTETTLGRPMDEALNEMAARLASKDFDFVITAVTIQRQVGGSLAGLFDMVADTVRQRQQFARKVRSLVAMGKMSAYVLLGLPFFLAGALSLLNREYMAPLYTTSTGQMLILVGCVMMGFGALVVKQIISFKG